MKISIKTQILNQGVSPEYSQLKGFNLNACNLKELEDQN